MEGLMTGTNDKRWSKWERTRKLGALRYVIQWRILYWGGSMFILTSLFTRYFGHRHIALSQVPWLLSIWGIGGLLFGVLTWSTTEWRFRRYQSRQARRL